MYSSLSIAHMTRNPAWPGAYGSQLGITTRLSVSLLGEICKEDDMKVIRVEDPDELRNEAVT